MSEDIMEFRDEVRAEWAMLDPAFSDPSGYRDFFNEKYEEMLKEEAKQQEKEAKRLEEIYKPNGWMKALRALDAPRLPLRLTDRMYKILQEGENFTPENKHEFKAEIALMGELLVIHDAFTKEKGAFQDLFGEYLTEHGKLNVRAGQFFTPMNVVDLMVMMTFPDDPEKMKGKPLTMCDPAAGSGRFMLRTAKHYADKIGYYNFVFYNVDVDRRMYTVCNFNAILNGIPSVNIWGNSLSLEVYEGIVTMPGQWHKLSKERAKAVLVAGSKTQQMKLTQPI